MTKIDLPPPVMPNRKMMPNEPCWCGSGQKWKKCHRNRSEEARPNYHQESVKFNRTFGKGVCLHPLAPGECSPKVIKAHTIQRSGGLKSISEQGHVYWTKRAIDQIHKNDGRLVPQLTGVREASTFSGFCNKHDTELFAPIEGKLLPLSRRTACLLTYRAVCLELHQKRAAIASLESMAPADAGLGLRDQIMTQNFLRDVIFGMKLGKQELEELREKLGKKIVDSEFSELNMAFVEFDKILPVMACCSFQPEWDFEGHALQKMDDKVLESVSLTLTSIDDHSIAAICWLGNDSEKSEEFGKSFLSIPDEGKATAISQAVFAHTENVMIKPSFWESLSKKQKSGVSRLMHFGMPDDDGMRPQDALSFVNSPFQLSSQILNQGLLLDSAGDWPGGI